MSKKPVVLMVLDGYGISDKTEGNAIALANTPVMDKLKAEYPYVKGAASGLAVGLPDGQMGNSEGMPVPEGICFRTCCRSSRRTDG